MRLIVINMDRLTNALQCFGSIYIYKKNIIHIIINIPEGWRGPFSGSRDLFLTSSWSPWGRHRCLVLPVASWGEFIFKISISTTNIVIINLPPVCKHHIGQVELVEHHHHHHHHQQQQQRHHHHHHHCNHHLTCSQASHWASGVHRASPLASCSPQAWSRPTLQAPEKKSSEKIVQVYQKAMHDYVQHCEHLERYT